jgi:hypothetical protein
MKPVRTAAPAYETSDWPVKVTGTDGKTGVDFCIEKVLLHSANNGLDNHYFPVQSTLSLLKHAYSAARYEIPGLMLRHTHPSRATGAILQKVINLRSLTCSSPRSYSRSNTKGSCNEQ